jgi:hypothetical protein
MDENRRAAQVRFWGDDANREEARRGEPLICANLSERSASPDRRSTRHVFVRWAWSWGVEELCVAG